MNARRHKCLAAFVTGNGSLHDAIAGPIVVQPHWSNQLTTVVKLGKGVALAGGTVALPSRLGGLRGVNCRVWVVRYREKIAKIHSNVYFQAI